MDDNGALHFPSISNTCDVGDFDDLITKIGLDVILWDVLSKMCSCDESYHWTKTS